jgi:hypothetical protein
MAIDAAAVDAIKLAVQSNSQPPEIATRLIQWLSDLSDAKCSLVDSDSVVSHVESILDKIRIETTPRNNSITSNTYGTKD